LRFISVSILLSGLMESYILFSSWVLVTPVTIPHACGQARMPLFSSVHYFWSPLLQSSIPVNILTCRILPSRLRLHFYLLHTWVGRRTIETKPKAKRTVTWGRPLGSGWWRGVRAAVLINYSRFIAAKSLFWQSTLQTVTSVSVCLWNAIDETKDLHYT
jgi:hypothetical protein